MQQDCLVAQNRLHLYLIRSPMAVRVHMIDKFVHVKFVVAISSQQSQVVITRWRKGFVIKIKAGEDLNLGEVEIL